VRPFFLGGDVRFFRPGTCGSRGWGAQEVTLRSVNCWLSWLPQVYWTSAAPSAEAELATQEPARWTVAPVMSPSAGKPL
jgi:hypothetical protein